MMYKYVLTLALVLVLTACIKPQHPADATQSEINMATMMGSSVEELRAQTPEEHMEMMMQMQHNQ